MRYSGNPPIYLLLSAPISLALAAMIGAAFRLDGQSGVFALPFIIVFWIASPVSIIWTTVAMLRKLDTARQNSSVIIALAALNAALLLACLKFL